MCTTAIPADTGQAQVLLAALLGSLAGPDPASLPAPAAAERLRILEQADAITAAVRGALLVVFDAQDGPWPTVTGTPGPGWSIRPGSPVGRRESTRPCRPWPVTIRSCTRRWPRAGRSPSR